MGSVSRRTEALLSDVWIVDGHLAVEVTAFLGVTTATIEGGTYDTAYVCRAHVSASMCHYPTTCSSSPSWRIPRSSTQEQPCRLRGGGSAPPFGEGAESSPQALHQPPFSAGEWETASVSSGLPIEVELHLGSLKRFRNRSMRNPRWLRDPDQVLAYLTHGIVPAVAAGWPEGSPLSEELRQVKDRLKVFRRYVRSHPAARKAGGDENGDRLWSAAVAAVDGLIEKAEEVNEGRLWRGP